MLSPVWASLIGFLTVYIAYRLHKLYPKETIVEYSEFILGRIAGKIIGLVYIFFYLHVNGIVIREYGEFVVGTFLQRTPMFAVAGILVLVSAFAVRGGVEVIARSAEMMVMCNIQALFLFGEITASLTYPVMVASRYISLADFLEHLESIVMAIWVAGTFIKISVFYYAIVLGTSQWLKLSDYRPLVFPIGFLLIVISFWSALNLQYLAHFLGTSSVFYFLSVQLGIPILLLIIAGIRKRIHPKKEEPKA